MFGLGLSFNKPRLDLDRKMWHSAHLWSSVDSYQNSNNTTILCIWAWERCRPFVWKRLLKKNEKEKKRYLIDAQFPLTKSSKQRKTARHCKTPTKSNIVSIGSYVWLFLQDFPQTVIACLNSIC